MLFTVSNSRLMNNDIFAERARKISTEIFRDPDGI